MLPIGGNAHGWRSMVNHIPVLTRAASLKADGANLRPAHLPGGPHHYATLALRSGFVGKLNYSHFPA